MSRRHRDVDSVADSKKQRYEDFQFRIGEDALPLEDLLHRTTPSGSKSLPQPYADEYSLDLGDGYDHNPISLTPSLQDNTATSRERLLDKRSMGVTTEIEQRPWTASTEGVVRQDRAPQRGCQAPKCTLFPNILLFLTISFAVLTAVYASGSVKASTPGTSALATSSSNSLLILRILSEISTLLLWATGVTVLEEVRWALAARQNGINIMNFVGLDAGTGLWGLFRLGYSSRWKYKGSVVTRILFLCSIPLPGIIIMSEISFDEVFLPQFSYPAAAGIAPFNGSMAKNLSTQWSTALCVSVGNPAWSPRNSVAMAPLPEGVGNCTSPSSPSPEWVPCDESYFLTGGFQMVSPQVDTLKGYPDASAIVVPNTMGYHMEFGQVRDVQVLKKTGLCGTRGDGSGAVMWCIAQGQSKDFVMGGVYCPIEIQNANKCLNDTSWTDNLTLSTSIFIFRRSATVSYSRSNFSILSLSNLSAPEPVNLPLLDVLISLNTASGSGSNCTGLAHYAATDLPSSNSDVAAILAVKNTRAVFGLVLLYFHANFAGAKDSIWTLNKPRQGLPADMYTTVSFAKLAYQAVASRRSLWWFVGLFGALTLVCVIALLGISNVRRRPNWIGFPVLDFSINCLSDREGDLVHTLTSLKGKEFKTVRTELSHRRVWALDGNEIRTTRGRTPSAGLAYEVVGSSESQTPVRRTRRRLSKPRRSKSESMP